MKAKPNRLTNWIITIMLTALLLTGAVPSFAADTFAAEDAKADSPVLPAITIDDSDAPKIDGTNAIIMDLDTGTVLYEKNADKVIEPASLTKILNCLVVLETLDLDEEITVPEDVETEGSIMWLNPGEKLTVRELVYGMMLESGNDAAQVLGLAAGGGDLGRFSDMMNRRAKECGATQTDFKNPNGLNEDRTRLNYTSARDLALISREAMKLSAFREVVGTAKHTTPKTNKSGKRTMRNSNVCLWLTSQTTEIGGKEVPFKYKGCNGIKTGFTSDAGYCFVGSAGRGGSDFLVVSLGAEDSENRFRDAILLWNYAFSKYETYPVQKAGTAAGVNRVWAGEKRTVEVGTQRDLGVTIKKGTADQQEFTTEFRLDDARAKAPIKKGQKMGQALVFNSKGRLVGRESLYALASVAEGGPLSHIGIADEDLPKAAAIAAAVLILIILLALIHRSRRRRERRREQETIRGELKSMRTSRTGMTARELTDVTGVEEVVPIPRGPARITDEELSAWTSTKSRPQEPTGSGRSGQTGSRNGRADAGRGGGQTGRGYDGNRPEPNRSGSRFGGNTPRGGYGNDPSATGGNESYMPKMQITPRTPFTSGGADSGTGQPLHKGHMTDDELFSMLDSTEVYDANQPRRHGRLTDTERRDLMKDSARAAQESAGPSPAARRRRRKRRAARRDSKDGE